MSQTIQFLDGAATGHLATPTTETGTGIVVIQEWWGLVPHIEDVCARFAGVGYAALAPDLYHGKSTVEAEEAQHLMEGLDWDRAVAEIGGAVAALRARGCAKVGAVGFCMGGALTVLAAKHAGVDAACAFYGFPPDRAAVSGDCAPTRVFFGEHEDFFSVPDAQAWAADQAAAGADTSVTVYPGAGHAFFNDTRPEAYHEAAAVDAWQQTLAHFDRHLRG